MFWCDHSGRSNVTEEPKLSKQISQWPAMQMDSKDIQGRSEHCPDLKNCTEKWMLPNFTVTYSRLADLKKEAY